MWRREDIELGQHFAHPDYGGSIYEVVAIIDRPVVVLCPVSARGTVLGGSPDIHQVIDSETFSYWKKVRYEDPQ